MLYAVVFRAEDGGTMLVYNKTATQPAVFEDRQEAVKLMLELQDAYPEEQYYVLHFNPVKALPEPTL